MTVHNLEPREQAQARAQDLAAECKVRLATVRMIIDELAYEVTPLVDRYTQLVALNTRLGNVAAYVPDLRQDLADRLHSRLGALRPYVPFVTDPDKE